MKYKGKKFITIDEEIERRAKKHILNKYSQITPEIFKQNKKHYIDEYFRDFPIMEKRFERMKREKRNIGLMLTMGLLSVSMLTVNVYNTVSKQQKAQEVKEAVYEDRIELKEIEPEQEFEYDKLLKKVEKLNNDASINYNRKEIIANEYNKLNPLEPITAERLGIKVYKPGYLIVKRDKLGNIVETRMKSDFNKEAGEEVIYGRNTVYQYLIDGKLVATYTSSGTKITDSRIKEENDFFELTIGMVTMSEKLKGAYVYQNSENDIKKYQKEYVDVAMNLDYIVEKRCEKQKEATLSENSK